MITEHWERILPHNSIGSLADLTAAVERVGLVYPFPPDPTRPFLPSAFPALATADDHQRWDWMWPWKEQLAESGTVYYGKLIGAKPTLVSATHLPLLFALTGQTGDLWDDLETIGESVRVPELAKQVLLHLEENGPTGTRKLAQALTDGSKGMKGALDKALLFLDSHLLIVKVGSEGGNSFANTWDLFGRRWAGVVDAGTAIPTREAAVDVLKLLFGLTPAIQVRYMGKLLAFGGEQIQRAVVRLQAEGWLETGLIEKKEALIAQSVLVG
ncbi:MAG TPA: hypothetical protein VK191_04320 [Symbiobacteriaceae bacterium]|nr:hypothetical protein [Symbiobacteriaceae bacterium]